MIPVCEPALSSIERQKLVDCFDSGWISSNGEFVTRFEEAFSSYIGCEYGVSVCNGTAALEAAIYALDIQPGDEVILPSFTIVSCLIAITRFGGVPVFTDVQADTWCVSAHDVASKISAKTKAIMVVHMYGHPAEMAPIMELADKHGVFVIEDASQVHGAEYHGAKCGSIGHISTFSFYANKIITTGEGGMVVTSNSKLAERAAFYRNLCFGKERNFVHEDIGNNLRMTSLQSAIGLGQLDRIEKFVEAKRRNGSYYREFLSDIDGVGLQVERPDIKSVYWMYCVVLDATRYAANNVIVKRLAEKGIGARVFFSPLHQLPALKERNITYRADGTFDVTNHISKFGFYLPSSVSLTRDTIKAVCEKTKEVLELN